MFFNSVEYFAFLPLVYLVFYFCGDRARWAVLLTGSICFYAALKLPQLLLALALVVVITYLAGIGMAKSASEVRKSAVFWTGVAGNLQVLRHYDCFYADPNIVYNRDYVSTEIFLANYHREHYDSFIFGSSRSLAFQCREWGRHIKASGIYHFDANIESLYGIYKKVLFLDRQGVKPSS